MLVKAIVILLIIMLLSNVALRIYNSVSPPCNNIDEYFASAKKLPDGVSAGLGSIPTGTNIHHVGFKLDAKDNGDIKLTNHTYNSPNFLSDDEFEKAISKIMPKAKVEHSTHGKKVEEVDGKLLVFDENEGMLVNNMHRPARRNIISSSGFVRRVDRDGYSDARPNDW